MTLNQRLQIVGVTSLIWIVCLSSCAALSIKTWFLDGKEYQSLVRKNSNGTLKEKLSFIEANGYRCYSPADDEAWRNRLIACCAKAQYE